MAGKDAESDRAHSVREQTEDMQRWAAAHGATLDLLPPELDVSGGNDLAGRPSLTLAIEGVEAGRYDGVIVAYLSRLGRRVRVQLEVWDRIEAAGGRVVSVGDQIDTSTPQGRFQRNVLASVAEMERDLHTERFARLRKSATAAGVWQRRQTPLGYRRDEQTRRLVPDDRADDVRWAFRARAHGTPVIEIARRLEMSTSGVRQLLANRVYLGELRVGQEVNPDAHPALVTVAEFEAVRAARRVRASAGGREPALLAGLVRCAACSHVMPRSRSGKWPVYTCSGHHSLGRCPGPASISLVALDEYVREAARLRLVELRASSTDNDRALTEAIEERDAARAELATYLRAVAAAGIGERDFAEGAGERRQRVVVAEARVERLRQVGDVPDDVDPVVFFDSLDVRGQGVVLRGLVEAVLVRAAGRGKRVRVGDRVRVIRAGSGLVSGSRSAERARPIVGVWVPVDDPCAIGVPVAEE